MEERTIVTPVTPWSQTLAVSWHPELRFFEERTTILRRLEDADLLYSFVWRGDTIGARLGPQEVLNISSSGASLSLVGPGARKEAGIAALEHALELLQPRELRIGSLLLQYLEGIDGDYDTVRQRSAADLIPAFPGARITDWATTIDGHVDTLYASFQVEFGIVDQAEAEDRLQGLVGRMTPRYEQAVPDDLWSLEGLPACALFMDWRWESDQLQRPSADHLTELVQQWVDLEQVSSDGVVAVHERAGRSKNRQMRNVKS